MGSSDTADVSHGDKAFTDLNFADDIALLVEMLEVSILGLSVMQK